MVINEEELVKFLSGKLGRSVELQHLSNVPAKSVYRMPGAAGEDGEGGDIFVKCAKLEDCRRSWKYFSVSTLPFVPRAKFFYEWNGCGVMGLGWMKEARRIAPEDMSEAQARNLLAAHARILAEFAEKLPDSAAYAKPLPDAAGFYETVCSYSRRHPLFARFLAPLRDIPQAERTYDASAVATIVNDFHCDNYAFDGDEVAAVYDFDWMRRGLACEDLTYAFIRRIRKARLSKEARARAAARFVQLVRSSPYPRNEWLCAINICRLDAAAKRLKSHPRLGLVALDVFRRDRGLGELVETLRA